MNISHNFWLNAWYGKSKWIYFLLPLSWLFRLISATRKYLLVHFFQQHFEVPIIVVGNISVGGTGKTPLIIALVNYLRQHGYTPGVISRGYGGTAPFYPYVLDQNTLVTESGDEPLLIFRSTQCHVCVAPDRAAAAAKLIDLGCTIILSDDGLQHYRLGRAIEIVVVDGARGFGNKQLLPVGPLREPVSRLKSVDMIVVNNQKQSLAEVNHQTQFPMKIQPLFWQHVGTEEIVPVNKFIISGKLNAVAGIGNPQRFFKTLQDMNIEFFPYSFDDHHQYSPADFENFGDDIVVMTEKDAVKCKSFAKKHWYSLVIGAQLPEEFWRDFELKIKTIRNMPGSTI